MSTSDTIGQLLILAKSPKVLVETSVHEASHAVLATLLGAQFDYVTAQSQVAESGEEVLAGHIRWTDFGSVTRDEAETYALALIAPQVTLPIFQIQRTSEQAKEEFSGDDFALDMLLKLQPKLTRSDLLGRCNELMTPAVRLAIYRVANALKDGKTLTVEDVQKLMDTDGCEPLLNLV